MLAESICYCKIDTFLTLNLTSLLSESCSFPVGVHSFQKLHQCVAEVLQHHAGAFGLSRHAQMITSATLPCFLFVFVLGFFADSFCDENIS